MFAGTALAAQRIETPLGIMTAVGDDESLYVLEFADRGDRRGDIDRLLARTGRTVHEGGSGPIESIRRELFEYFESTRTSFHTPLAAHGTEFDAACAPARGARRVTDQPRPGAVSPDFACHRGRRPRGLPVSRRLTEPPRSAGPRRRNRPPQAVGHDADDLEREERSLLDEKRETRFVDAHEASVGPGDDGWCEADLLVFAEPKMGRSTFPILVVDDDADLRHALQDILRDEGYLVACVDNGRQALDVLQAGARPCVILLDIKMPQMDGLTFRREQMQDPSIADIPVVFFTADSSGKGEAEGLGVTFFLKKPVDLLQLLEVAAHHCDDPDRIEEPVRLSNTN